jgi:transcriptional regulator with XRE-family HTH domain
MEAPHPSELLQNLASFLKEERLRSNLSQDQVADLSGLSRKTITQLENGKGGNLESLIKVLDAIKRLDVWSVFEVKPMISPLQLAKLARAKRKRATGTRIVKPKPLPANLPRPKF